MKIKIKKFCNLSEIDIETPCRLIGAQGAGKSTILRSLYYLLNCSDPKTGKRFDERIYSENARSHKNDDFAEVSGYLNNIKLTRKSTPKTSRVRGSDEVNITYNVESTYYINDIQCNLNEYNEVISNHFVGFSPELFLSTAGFLNSSKDEKRAIFEKIIGEKKDFTDEKNEKKSKVTDIKKDISIKKNILSDRKADLLIECKNPTAEILLINSQIESLRKEKDDIQQNLAANAPKLTQLQVDENNAIRSKIAEIERERYVSKIIDLSQVVNKINDLRNELSLKENQIQAVTDKQIDEIIDTSYFDEKLNRVVYLTHVYQNYDEIIGKSRCNKCAICFIENCPEKEVGIESFEAVETELNYLLSQHYDVQKSDFVAKKQKEIESKKQAKADELTRLNEAKSELEREINKQNAEFLKLKKQKEAVEKSTQKEISDFEKNKEIRINELLNKLHHVEEIDSSKEDAKIKEIVNKISELQIKLNELQTQKKRFDEICGIRENAEKRIKELSEEIISLEKSLVVAEREQIGVENQEVEYFRTLENNINSILPSGVTVSLFKENVSKDGFKFDFELNFNNKLDFSTSEEMEQFIPFLQFLHKTLGIIDIPICVDEFNVFTGNINNFGNVILCVADKTVNQLLIEKL